MAAKVGSASLFFFCSTEFFCITIYNNNSKTKISPHSSTCKPYLEVSIIEAKVLIFISILDLNESKL